MDSGLQKSNEAHRIQKTEDFWTTVAGFIVYFGIVVALGGLILFPYAKDDLSKLGDFFSGTAGIILSLAAIILIYVAFLGQRRQLINQEEEIRINRIELQETKEEIRGQKEQLILQNTTLELQKFENTFFQLLRLHNDIVQGINIKYSGNQTIVGRNCFRVLLHELRNTYHTHEERRRYEFTTGENYDKLVKRISEEEGLPIYVEYRMRETIKNTDSLPLNEQIFVIRFTYNEIYSRYQSDLGHYYRNLYCIIRFIKGNAEQGKLINPQFYTDLVRAQLSSNELVMVFYNCLSQYGEIFKPLVEEFALLHGVPNDQLITIEHLELYDQRAFGERESV